MTAVHSCWYTSNWCNCLTTTTTTTTKHMPKDLSIHAPPSTREDTEQMGDVRTYLKLNLIIEIHCFHLFCQNTGNQFVVEYTFWWIIFIIFIPIYFQSFSLNFKCNQMGDVMTFMKVQAALAQQADRLEFYDNIVK